MIASFDNFNFGFSGGNIHQNLLLNKIMRAVADFAMPATKARVDNETLISYADAILQLNERSAVFFNDITSYFDNIINLYNLHPEELANTFEQLDNEIIVQKIEFYKSKAIEIDLINRPVFDSFIKFEKKAKAYRHPKVNSALSAISQYKKMYFNHQHKVNEFISILNQFVVSPTFPTGQTVLTNEYISSLVASSDSFLKSIH